jgi:nucleoside 2-deoxyribosyltransferase
MMKVKELVEESMVKFYIASSLQNKENVQYVASHLKACGFIHTYDWTKNVGVDTAEKLKEVGEAERQGVEQADILVLLLPGGKGTHVELGMALAHYKRVYLYSPNEEINDFSKTSTFYFLEEVKPFVGSLDEFIMNLIEQEQAVLIH